MCHMVKVSRLLATRIDVGHATPNTLDEPSHNATPSYHDDEGGDHASCSTTPSNHDQGVNDPFGSTPPHHSPDD